MPALSQYQAITQSLIQSPQSPIPLLPTATLTLYINIARSQVAADGECTRTYIAAGTVVPGLVIEPLTTITVQAGFSQVLLIRNAFLNAARIDIRPWDWFAAYYLQSSPTVTPVMAFQSQGTLTNYFIVSLGGSMTVDANLLPENLVDDTTPDVIPYPWSDAVPFYAAWYAYMSFQRQADADMFMVRYRELMHRARSTSTSTNLPENDPGGIGAQIAAGKIPLGTPPAPPGRGAAMGR